ncbi:4-alpha-glucanotransferase [Anabaena cylindrica FACHB-243]|uniref:4-alpha-glucanotransferase n=1 Tax=Anabaena cylindrica (strain ATCC 27899 / PCC 7122) TaxID=272123 RepID=K9ZHP3_ANACC|nr:MULTISPECIES: 4-alpha-glucanotransferase [Anabaena]AFZ58097.1 4-alpha-glucanotransferase [Anabaena cylindrica PCC 7122]MBD2419128.1 4-alpha-glucanotransferase [Anabaena cylindrica FACHB-243]MBY5284051.1 4-alpha-glucanotransferase [Anabaena sp. CCAP 1446/1C]MBY5306812.1 4-alpha-glucanotransferase [Anabaena sp. CCAP 1446/1C]MCM2409598.1 4-alpha-glucanotransferase [Anabaena sp. CCAP 1446/1C]
MPFPRSSGILLHPSSFPSRFGIGDLGLEAYRFIDFLKNSYQQYWQVLPLGPTGYGNSPYMCYSAMAGNYFLISLEKLVDEGFLAEADFANLPEFPTDKVDFEQAIPIKVNLLKKACENFKTQATAIQRKAFHHFCNTKGYWLDNYALFMALKDARNGASWHTWEPQLARREPAALSQIERELTDEIFYYKFVEYEFFRQWSELKNYANQNGIDIIGDIPIYVAHDSADVWANPDNFALDEETGEAALMAGVPPDYFSATGQLWGNPVYNWEELQKQDFKWWVQRFEAMLDYVDIIRIDHFRGFEAYWAVPQGEETAVNGEWIEAPGVAFFEVIKQKLGKLPILAEDLGIITPEVEALRDQFEFPGMKVLHFAFGSDPGNPFLPFNYPRNAVVYTGTHDNDTTVGWFNSANDYEKQNLLLYLGSISPDGINWDLIRLALSSIANQAIIPLQDVLGLGTQARMNYPSTAEGNWGWRYQAGVLSGELCDRLQNLTKLYGRAPSNS